MDGSLADVERKAGLGYSGRGPAIVVPEHHPPLDVTRQRQASEPQPAARGLHSSTSQLNLSRV